MNADQPAYPQHGWTNDPKILDRMRHQSGLTKREYFAAMAMQGILSNNLPWNNIVKASIDYADALLAELEKKEK